MKIHILSLLTVSFIFLIWLTKCTSGSANGVCDRNSGPAGPVHCVQLSRYGDYQWATCLTDAYIQQTSRKKYHCEDRRRVYCYFQCMLELYGKVDGTVYGQCTCDGKKKQHSTLSPATLPEWCFSPDGSSCGWYRQCLEKRYPCEGEDEDYAIAFAEKFCNLYTKRYSKFSSEGQSWIDAVRKCLQVALVPLLRPWQEQTCKALKERAFASHSPCYLNPDGGAISFCDLSYFDQMQVFWTVKRGFTSAFVPSVQGLMATLKGCRGTTESISDAANTTLSQFALIIKRTSPARRRKRALNGSEVELGYFAGKVIDAVALEQKWNKKGVAWFVFAPRVMEQSHRISIVAQLADRYTYELPGASNDSRPSHPVDINSTLLEMADKVKHGRLVIPNIGKERVVVIEMKGCGDWDCKNFIFNVTAASRSAAGKIKGFGSITFYGVFILPLLLLFK